MLHCPFLLPRSCSRRFPGGTRSVSTIVAAASMSSLRNATLAMGANRRLPPVSYSSCVALHLNDEIICIVYYAPHNMSMGRTRNLKSDARAVNNTQTGLLQRFRGACPQPLCGEEVTDECSEGRAGWGFWHLMQSTGRAVWTATRAWSTESEASALAIFRNAGYGRERCQKTQPRKSHAQKST